MRLGLLPGAVAASGGPGAYVTGFVRALGEVAPEIQVQPWLIGSRQITSRARAERAALAELLAVEQVRAFPVSPRLYRSAIRRFAPRFDSVMGFHDVYHQTHLNMDPIVPDAKLVVTLHDLVAEKWGDEGALLATAQTVLARAAAVITGSVTSRHQILNRFATVAPERVHVVPHGVDQVRFNPLPDANDAAILAELGIQRPFLLYVGGISRRKNVKTLLEAHELASRDGAPLPPLVLVGPWAPGQVPHPSGGGVWALGSVPAPIVPMLMRQCAAVVVPSRDEGFGLPVLEAQACGAIVICSNIPVFREIGGRAPYYVESASAEDLANELRTALDATDQAVARRSQGLLHVQQYSWEKSALEHSRLYQAVLDSEP